MIGREAAAALSPFLSNSRSAHFTQVIIGGWFLRIESANSARIADRVSNDAADFAEHLLNEYINRLSTAFLCRAFHDIEVRLCRWLLTLAEKCDCQPIGSRITPQQIAVLPGANRPTVSRAAKDLERQKTISCCRGNYRFLILSDCERSIVKMKIGKGNSDVFTYLAREVSADAANAHD